MSFNHILRKVTDVFSGTPQIHCQDELMTDLAHYQGNTDALLFKWHRDAYSTSKHLLTLYSLAIGLRAKHIAEIGFGRSSIVLAKAALENEGHFTCCDSRDFSYLLPTEFTSATTFFAGNSAQLWDKFEQDGVVLDFAFLDYLSNEALSSEACISEVSRCLSRVRQNGLVAIHDTLVPQYKIGEALQAWATQQDSLEYLVLPFNYGLGLIRQKGNAHLGMLEDQWLKKDG